MEKGCLSTFAGISLVLLLGAAVLAQEAAFEYPYYLLGAYNPDDDCWKGMDADGLWPVPVIPGQWLVGQPPSLDVSGVTLPIDHWVELKFRGRIVDGPGDDIFLVELDAVAEKALVFLTDGAGQEYLLGLAAVPDVGTGPNQIGFDIAGLSLSFVPSGVRILGIDLRGGSPGFDLANVRARTYSDCGSIACNPYPVDGAVNVPADAVLSWSQGCSVGKHTVYFGTAFADVDENAIPVDRPVQPQDVNSFDPGGLELNETYYWRVDEVNDADANSPLVGDVWRFTVADHLVVDDFESYDSYGLHNIWMQVGEAYVDLSKSPDPVYRCRRSMAFYYYCDDYFYSEATRRLSPAQDWAAADIKALELFFRGRTTNGTGAQMYLALSDGKARTEILYNGNANDIAKEMWQLWRIDLQDANGVNLSNVESISIGFRAGPTKPSWGNEGFVFFDDITLYPSGCLEENRPIADFDGDCAVGFEDVEEMAHCWLDKGYSVYPVAHPNAPLAVYKFDGNANDSVGIAHGRPHGNPTYVPGVFGQAISFDGYENYVEIIGAANLFAKIGTGITIAFWQYGADSPHHTDTLCCSNYAYGRDDPAIAINLGCWYSRRRFASQKRSSGGRYNWDCGRPWSFDSRLSGEHRYKDEWSSRWNHWAFTKDAETGTMQIFLNGKLFDSRTGANSPIWGITSFEIGSGWYGGYDGLIDEFRIYDYALSQAEVAHVATNGTGIFDQTLICPADLNSNNQIDFKDFAILADHWLEEHLWP